MKLARTLLILALLALSSGAKASEPTSIAETDRFKSHDWWRGLAVHYADEIADADAQGEAHYKLAYARARAGDVDGAHVSATKVTNPHVRIHVHCFVAKHYKQRGDDEACRSELHQARKVARETKIGSYSTYVIQGYLEMGYPADAISFAKEIPNAQQREFRFWEIAATLARQGDLGKAHDVVKRNLPPNRKEGALSMMANACARELRVEEVNELASQLTNTVSRDNAYVNLVEALVRAGRNVDAAEFANRVSDPMRKAAAHATITGKVAKGQSIETLESRIEEATSREERIVLYRELFARRVEAGNVAEAEAVIESMVKTIEESPRKAQMSKFGIADDAGAIAAVRSQYLTTAKLLAGKGDRKGSLLRTARARKAVLGMAEEAGIGKSLLVATLVRLQIDVGDVDGARSTLSEIKQDFSRSNAAADLAVAFVKSGDVKSAMQVAEQITAQLGKGSAVGRVLSELIRAGELALAKEMLRRVGCSKEEVKAFRAVGGTMVELERGPELHQWLNEMTSNVARAHACIGAAETLQKLNTNSLNDAALAD